MPKVKTLRLIPHWETIRRSGTTQVYVPLGPAGELFLQAHLQVIYNKYIAKCIICMHTYCHVKWHKEISSYFFYVILLDKNAFIKLN